MPADHPGLVAMAAQYDQFDKYVAVQNDEDGNPIAGTGEGATFYGRIAGVTGFLGTGLSRQAKREYDTYRVAASFDGEFDNGVGWDIGITYSNSESELKALTRKLAAPSWLSAASAVILAPQHWTLRATSFKTVL